MRSPSPVPDARSRALSRWRHYLSTDGSVAGLRQFHTRHRLLLLAHDPDAYRALGGVLDQPPALGLSVVHARYERMLTTALSHHASRAQHLNVLEHAARGILDRLSDEERSTWSTTLRDYRRDNVDLAVPQALLRRMVRRVAPRSWAARQAYLDPRPSALAAD